MNYDSWKLSSPPHYNDIHNRSCFCHEDAEPICTCGCLIEGHPEDDCAVDSHLCEGPEVDEEPDCICGDLGGE